VNFSDSAPCPYTGRSAVAAGACSAAGPGGRSSRRVASSTNGRTEK